MSIAVDCLLNIEVFAIKRRSHRYILILSLLDIDRLQNIDTFTTKHINSYHNQVVKLA